MKTPQVSRRLLLGSLLAALTVWLGGCQSRTAAPPRQPAPNTASLQEERSATATTAPQREQHSVRVIYTYDDKGNRLSVRRGDHGPAEPPTRLPDAP